MSSTSAVLIGLRLLCVTIGLASLVNSQSIEQWKSAVVAVQVGKGSERPLEIGTGFIASVEGEKVTVITARHLFYEQRESFASDITVVLAVDKLHPHKAALITDSAALDLAALEVAGVPSASLTRIPTASLRPTSEPLRIGETLFVLGGKSEGWQVSTVAVSDTEDGDRPNGIRFTANGIRGGFSGSAIVDGSGRLVAVHEGVVESDGNFGRAQLMAGAYRTLLNLGLTMNRLQVATATVPPPGNPANRQVASCLTPPKGLVSWWTGDRDEKDVIGGNDAVSAIAVSHVPGMVQNGFQFGKNGLIEIQPSPSLANRQFTWLAWVRPDGPSPTNDAYGGVIVGQNIDNMHDSVDLTWSARSNEFVFNFGPTRQDEIMSSETFPPGRFYLVAGTFDGRVSRLYVDGAPQGFLSGKGPIYSSRPWTIGGADRRIAQQGYPRTWNGVIDEVQAFDRALDEPEIKSIFKAGRAGECKPASARDLKLSEN